MTSPSPDPARRPDREIRREVLALAFRLLESQFRLNIPRLFAALVLLSFTGVLIYAATSLVSYLLLRKWHESAVRREN